MSTASHVYRCYIGGTVEEVWDAIVNPDKTSRYYYGTSVDSTWEVGAPINYHYPDGSLASQGEILAIDPPKRIEFTFLPLWDDEIRAEGPVREVWTLETTGAMVELVIELYEIGPKTLETFTRGLPYIVSGLKSLVETGEGLPAARPGRSGRG